MQVTTALVLNQTKPSSNSDYKWNRWRTDCCRRVRSRSFTVWLFSGFIGCTYTDAQRPSFHPLTPFYWTKSGVLFFRNQHNKVGKLALKKIVLNMVGTLFLISIINFYYFRLDWFLDQSPSTQPIIKHNWFTNSTRPCPLRPLSGPVLTWSDSSCYLSSSRRLSTPSRRTAWTQAGLGQKI